MSDINSTLSVQFPTILFSTIAHGHSVKVVAVDKQEKPTFVDGRMVILLALRECSVQRIDRDIEVDRAVSDLIKELNTSYPEVVGETFGVTDIKDGGMQTFPLPGDGSRYLAILEYYGDYLPESETEYDPLWYLARPEYYQLPLNS